MGEYQRYRRGTDQSIINESGEYFIDNETGYQIRKGSPLYEEAQRQLGIPTQPAGTEKTREEKIAEETAGDVAKIDELQKQNEIAAAESETQNRARREQLIAALRGQGTSLLSDVGRQRQQRLSSLSELLGRQREQAFSQSAPDIMEQLSGRGLLQSSYTGEALAKEKSRLQQLSENSLQAQALADLDYEQNLRTNIEDKLMALETGGLSFSEDMAKGLLQNRFGLGSAGLERQFSLEDWYKNADLSKELARIQGSATRDASQNQLMGQLGGIGLTKLLSFI